MRFFAIAVKKDASRLELPVLPYTVPSLSGIKSNTILASKIDAGEYIGLSDLIDAIHKEDMLSIEILEEIGFNLGKGIAGLMNIFNPELVVLGGPLSQTGEYLSLPIKSAVRKYSLNLVTRDTQIKVSKLGERAGILGACLLSRSKILGMI